VAGVKSAVRWEKEVKAGRGEDLDGGGWPKKVKGRSSNREYLLSGRGFSQKKIYEVVYNRVSR
jgi:hypothetical protein